MPATLTILLALVIAAFNFHFSFIRPWLHKRRTGSMENFRFVSGIPLIGTVLVVIGLAIGFRAIIPTGLAAMATVIDTGGLPWFLFATWRDRSLWDE